MYQLGYFISQYLLGLINSSILQAAQTMNLLHRQEGQKCQALLHISIVHIAPVLIEIIDRSLFLIQPESTASSFAHLLAIALGQQSKGKAINRIASLATGKLYTANNIGPLIIATHFQLQIVATMKLQEVIGLHNHVVELQEGQALFHTVLVALSCQHTVNSKMRSYIPQQLNVVQLAEPISVVDNQSLVIAEIKKSSHLLLEAIAIVLNILVGKHLAHIGTTRWITYSTSTAAYQANRTMTCSLHMGHNHQAQKMTYMKAVCCWIKTYIEGYLLVSQHLPHFVLVGALGNIASFLQYIKNTCTHFIYLSLYGPIAFIPYRPQLSN